MKLSNSEMMVTTHFTFDRGAGCASGHCDCSNQIFRCLHLHLWWVSCHVYFHTGTVPYVKSTERAVTFWQWKLTFSYFLPGALWRSSPWIWLFSYSCSSSTVFWLVVFPLLQSIYCRKVLLNHSPTVCFRLFLFSCKKKIIKKNKQAWQQWRFSVYSVI